MFGLSTVVPELHVTLRVQGTLFEELAFLRKDVFQGDGLVGEDLNVSMAVACEIRTWITNLQVIGDEVSVLAARTCDQDGSMVVALLGHAV